MVDAAAALHVRRWGHLACEASTMLSGITMRYRRCSPTTADTTRVLDPDLGILGGGCAGGWPSSGSDNAIDAAILSRRVRRIPRSARGLPAQDDRRS